MESIVKIQLAHLDQLLADKGIQIKLDDKASCWGLNMLGQTDIPVEVRYDTSVKVKMMALGLMHSCMV